MAIKSWKMFNPEVKYLFLDKQFKNKLSRYTYEVTLGRISEYEYELGKDIFNMNVSEFREALDILTKTTIISASSNVSRIIKYFEWAVANNFTENVETLSWLKATKTESLVSKVAMENQYITQKEMYQICDYCKNAQDAGEIMLMFYGACGFELSEIRFLRYSDINHENNTVILTNKKNIIKNNETKTIYEKRTLQLTEKDIEILDDAYKASSYTAKRLNRGRKTSSEYISVLIENGFVFKHTENIIKKTNDDYCASEISVQIVGKRIRRVMKDYGKPQINAKTLNMSGMINELNLLNKEYSKITDAEYADILKKFNKTTIGTNLYNLKKTYKFLIDNNMEVATTSI